MRAPQALARSSNGALARMELVLASASEHRARILEQAGFSFRVHKTNIKEDLPDRSNPHHFVRQLATKKAETAHRLFPQALILAADTMVIDASGLLLGKPRSRKQAAAFLRNRSASYEEVITGFCLRYFDRLFTGCASSRIHYAKIPTSAQEAILATEEWRGVCGGLKIEGLIGPYIQTLKGDKDNVMGLPLRAIAPLIKRIKQEGP